MLTAPPGCRNDVESAGAPLVCGSRAGRNVLLVGDSVALTWGPAVREAFSPDRGWGLQVVGYASCPLYAGTTALGPVGDFSEECAQRQRQLMKLIEAEAPDVLVLSASEGYLSSVPTEAKQQKEEWFRSTKAVLAQLSHVPHVILLSNPPRTEFPSDCATRWNGPSACLASVSLQYQHKAEAEQSASREFENVTFVDARSWFCGARGCPLYVDGIIQRTDNTHLTAAASESLGTTLRSAIELAAPDLRGALR